VVLSAGHFSWLALKLAFSQSQKLSMPPTHLEHSHLKIWIVPLSWRLALESPIIPHSIVLQSREAHPKSMIHPTHEIDIETIARPDIDIRTAN